MKDSLIYFLLYLLFQSNFKKTLEEPSPTLAENSSLTSESCEKGTSTKSLSKAPCSSLEWRLNSNGNQWEIDHLFG
jgi:hypothetical protein